MLRKTSKNYKNDIVKKTRVSVNLVLTTKV